MIDRPIGVTTYVPRSRCDQWVHDPDQHAPTVSTRVFARPRVVVVRIERPGRRFRRDRTGENA
jgi:hypothetical protein